MSAVYLLGDSGKNDLYKIGVTRGSVEKRIRKLQTGNGGELYLIREYRTEHPFLTEKLLHQKFCGKNEINEWYRLTDEDVLGFVDTCEDIESNIMSVRDNHFLSFLK